MLQIRSLLLVELDNATQFVWVELDNVAQLDTMRKYIVNTKQDRMFNPLLWAC